jgi:hypothetical protein
MYQARLRGDLREKGSPHLFILNALILTAFLLIFFLLVSTSHAQQVNLAWNANTETDLQAYKVYQGTASGTYSSNSNVGNTTSCTISGLETGKTYYFSVTALDSAGNESGHSNEVSYMIPAPAPPPEPEPTPTPEPTPIPEPTPAPTPEPAQELVISATPYTSWSLGTKSRMMLYAQSFKAIGSKIESVAIALAKYRSPTMPVRVSIRKTSPGGEILASGQILPSQVTSKDYRNPSWTIVTFSTPAAVTQGSTYYLVLDVPTYNSRNYYRVPQGKNSYPDGVAYQSALTQRSYYDLVCRISFGL